MAVLSESDLHMVRPGRVLPLRGAPVGPQSADSIICTLSWKSCFSLAIYHPLKNSLGPAQAQHRHSAGPAQAQHRHSCGAPALRGATANPAPRKHAWSSFSRESVCLLRPPCQPSRLARQTPPVLGKNVPRNPPARAKPLVLWSAARPGRQQQLRRMHCGALKHAVLRWVTLPQKRCDGGGRTSVLPFRWRGLGAGTGLLQRQGPLGNTKPAPLNEACRTDVLCSLFSPVWAELCSRCMPSLNLRLPWYTFHSYREVTPSGAAFFRQM
ncbi:hypothetical protein JZ751_006219 [Albula glossodonta]|uniref:Uncharacterized protein n=1 Tax=Albula glossodonta TaxID=121402 RepID=A0A8T2N503_9TELE|nr:hypothetical protein JZ751_006219 [Albula glossodonta]